MVTARTVRLRLLNTKMARFYDIRLSKNNGTWKTTSTFGRIGHVGTTQQLFSGTSMQNAILAGERFERKKVDEGYVKISGSMRRG